MSGRDALDPAALALLDLIRRSGEPPIEQLSPAEARIAYHEARLLLQPPPPPIQEVRDFTCPGPGGPIPLRLYRPMPAGSEGEPTLIFFHGGGWVIGDLETHDVPCRQIALASGCTVVSVEYRLAPEAKFPAAVEDAIAATAWIAHEGRAIGVDPDRLAVGGDSAGGTLAAAVCLHAREHAGPDLRLQVLIYPAADMSGALPSHQLFGRGLLLTRDAMAWFSNHYLRGPEDAEDPRASPLVADDLTRLPPALVLTAGCDPLRDEGEAYADKLAAAGVPVTRRRYDGQIHGFLTMGRYLPVAEKAVSDIAEALRRAM